MQLGIGDGGGLGVCRAVFVAGWQFVVHALLAG
ncbi:hypothetical protein FHX82_002656 [Amycolatopsis bartoniae]|nr:hypothetical protein [Amycolatopsis bartoniae]